MKNLPFISILFLFIAQFWGCKKDAGNSSTNPKQSELSAWGIQGNFFASKSLDKTYNFYFDQKDESLFEINNCGPTVATMASLWEDSLFNKTPLDARNTIKPTGEWWSTRDIVNYLGYDKINTKYDTLANIEQLVQNYINQNKLIILCLDMYYVTYNPVYEDHVQKFYQDNIGSGHFLLVKGYLKTDAHFYLEVYDPNSWGQVYHNGSTAGSLKGKNRYYLSDDIKTATDNWWKYAIIVDTYNSKVLALNSYRTTPNQKSIPIAYGK